VRDQLIAPTQFPGLLLSASPRARQDNIRLFNARLQIYPRSYHNLKSYLVLTATWAAPAVLVALKIQIQLTGHGRGQGGSVGLVMINALLIIDGVDPRIVAKCELIALGPSSRRFVYVSTKHQTP